MRRLDAFQEDYELVLQKLHDGYLDHVEIVSRVVETDFFRQCLGDGGIQKLAESYPSPRKKHDVPLWLYLATQLTLRLHGGPGFSSLPYILHCGGLRDALEDGQAARRVDPETERSQLSFKGYNEKNSYDRRTPCDQDYVRKLAKDTEPERLQAWYGSAAASHFKDLEVYDSEGIFFVDGSYLFVPDNERYEGSRVALFDEHNHPISREAEQNLSETQRKRCQFRRYYQMVALSHSDRAQDFLLYCGAKMLSEGDKGAEVGQLVPLVDSFHAAVGSGVMKTLVVDRGFIDGKSITQIKTQHDVDVVVPLKAGMNITADAWKLAEVDDTPWQEWTPPPKEKAPDPPQRPEHIRKAEQARQETIAKKKAESDTPPKARLERVELKVIPRIKLWASCDVALDVVLMREYMSDGECSEWGLMTTRQVDDPLEIRELYALRPACEEGWRQMKCYWDLTGFRSTSYSLVVNQVIFVLLAHSLLQAFLVQSERGDLAKATRKRLLAELLPDGEKVAVYWQNHVGYLRLMQYTHIILNLEDGPRRRLRGTINRLNKAQLEPPTLPERPTL